jgi:lysophospholipase L1-like esterase
VIRRGEATALLVLAFGAVAVLALALLPGGAEARCTDAACAGPGPGPAVATVGVRLAGPRAVLAGMPFEYVATVTRAPDASPGPRRIGFRISESPPVAAPRMRFPSGRTTGGTCSPVSARELACRTAPLAAGRSAAISIDAVADGPGLFAPQGAVDDSGDRATFRVSTRAYEGGFAWNMVERTHSVAAGPDLRFTTTNPSSPDIAPADLQVRFTCLGAPALPPGTTLRWEVAAPGEPFVALGSDACRFTQPFPRDAPRRVRLTSTVPTRAGPFSLTSEEPVQASDLLVVSVGDSYASGQGDPPFDFGSDYFPGPCYRSRASGPSQAAAMLERDDPHTSVTFLSVACDGAEVQNGLLGVETTRDGTAIAPPQLEQVRQIVGGSRPIDALLISVGGNDVGFASVIEACARSSCERMVRRQVPGRLRALGADYRQLVSAIAGLAPRRTYITEYPDFLRWSDGGFCGKRTLAGGGHPYPGALSGISRDESIALHDVGLVGLRRTMDGVPGWQVIAGVASRTREHGLCAPASYFNSVEQSLRRQGDIYGTAHPNALGHRAYAEAIREALGPLLSPARSGAGRPWTRTGPERQARRAALDR